VSGPTTATVETLTAEVRTLVVGSRQVTLSIAKQLDWVPISDLRIMGRVKLSPDEDTVIGSAPDGSLAIAKYSRYPNAKPIRIYKDDLNEPVRVCKYIPQRLYSEFFPLDFYGVPIEIHKDAVVRCEVVGGKEAHSGCGWNPLGQQQTIHKEISRQRTANALYLQQSRLAVAAPLIVLAGLK
jgi:hypothetical protein